MSYIRGNILLLKGKQKLPQQKKYPTVICYDVEDIIAPESDDVALWLAEILNEFDLKGSFMVVGEKVRLWEKRGRQDVIEAFKKHHIAYHSTWHSVHPTTTEHCLDRNFAQGIEALRDWDMQGWRDTERILGRPMLGWARTGSSWAPSVQGLMAELGRAYAYSLIKIPGHDVCWYANCLGFYGAGVGSIDDVICDENGFNQRISHAQDWINNYIASGPKGAKWICWFIGHPTRFISTAFWDAVNFSKGANPPRSEWKSAPQLDSSLIPLMQERYRQVCKMISEDERLEVVGLGDLIQRYDGQKPSATHAELTEIAQRIADEKKTLFTDFFTVGEILLMLCEAIQSSKTNFVRPRVFGPLTTPPISQKIEFSREEIIQSAHFVLDYAKSGYLPASVSVSGENIGLGTYFVALAQAFLGQEKITSVADSPYPERALSWR